MNLFDLSGKTAVVIGGNSTLGGAMCVALGAYGAKVAVVGRNQEKAEAVKAQVEEAGGVAKCFSADTTSKEDLNQLLSDVLSWTGSVDVLLNCPGKNSATPFFELEMDEWDSIMDGKFERRGPCLSNFWEANGGARIRGKHHQHLFRF